MSCIACDCETKKYKCPKCTEYYCSVPCFAKHKEIGCEKISSTEEDDSESQIHQHGPSIPFKTEDTVDLNKLKQLSENTRLKTCLRNPHLRKFLLEIDESPNAWNAMKLAMQEPLFLEFADECLKIVDPPDEI